MPRLYPTIRPGARYYASLRLLESVKRHDPTIFTKSGLMLGLGEERLEVHQVMDDMCSADIDFLTMGQYLQPTPRHTKVLEFVPPKSFEAYAAISRAKGFLLVAASPLTRSSYHAGDDFKKLRARRQRMLTVSISVAQRLTEAHLDVATLQLDSIFIAEMIGPPDLVCPASLKRGTADRHVLQRKAPAVLLGSGLIGHSQKMTVAASATAEKKTVGQRS